MPDLRIFLADAHDVLRRGWRSLVTSHPGWSICGEARSGLDAVRLSLEMKPDVVIVGRDLLDINSIEAARRIVQARPEMQILFYTTDDEEYLMIEALRAGVRAHVLTSDSEDTLIQAVVALADRLPYFSVRATETLLDRTARSGAALDDLQALTDRERQIIQLIADGKSNSETATCLKISVKTVEAHRSAIMRKCGLGSITDLVRYAIRQGFIEP